MLLYLQFYQQLPDQDINEHYLWRQRLEPILSYLNGQHREKVREALSLAYDAHTTQKRKSGEPYITHPVEVTRILAELKMDHESLIAGNHDSFPRGTGCHMCGVAWPDTPPKCGLPHG